MFFSPEAHQGFDCFEHLDILLLIGFLFSLDYGHSVAYEMLQNCCSQKKISQKIKKEFTQDKKQAAPEPELPVKRYSLK